VIVVVVAAAILVPVVLSKHGTSTASGGNSAGSSTTPAPPSSAIMLRMSATTGPPLTWGSLAVYDACAVLPMSTVRQDGVVLDEESPVEFDRPEGDLPGGGEYHHVDNTNGGITNCDYHAMNDVDGVSLDIYQTPFNTSSDFQDQLQLMIGQTPAQPEDGFNVYPHSSGQGHTQVYLMSDGGTLAGVLVVNLQSNSLKGHSFSDVVTGLTNSEPFRVTVCRCV
jgi:hypothetical protein